jgi:hypothetical protein
MQVQDGQTDFSGGMVDRVSSNQIAPNEYVLGKNVEMRDGPMRSRRGSWLIHPDVVDTIAATDTEVDVTGTGRYISPQLGVETVFVQSIYLEDVNETIIARTTVLGDTTRRFMRTPDTIPFKQTMRFVQGFGVLYALRGDTSDVWQWDGFPDTGWEVAPDGVNGPFPRARDGIFAYNRLWLIAGDDTLNISDSLSANFNTTTNSFEVDNGDGGRLNSLVAFGEGQIAFGKDVGVGVITGASAMSSAADLAMHFLHTGIGCLSMDCMVNMGRDVFFADRTGVWSINLTAEQSAQLISVPLSDPIRNMYQGVDFQFGRSFSAAYYDNYFLVAVSVSGGSVPNRILAYDMLTRTWAGYWEYDAVSSPDDDGLYRHHRLMTVNIQGRRRLLSFGAYGSVAVLLRGDVRDFVGLETEHYFTYPRLAASDSVDLTEHTTGSVRMKFRALIGTTVQLMTKPFSTAVVANTTAGRRNVQFNWTLSGSWAYSDVIYTSEGQMRFFENTWHILEVSHNGVEPTFTLDDERLVVDNTTNTTITDWISGVGGTNMWIGVSNTADRGRIAWFRISTDDATTTSPSQIWVPLDEGSGSTYHYETETNGVYAEVSDSHIATWGTDTYTPTDITSELMTRGFRFSSELDRKGGLQGDLYFSHGQPRVDLEIETDTPFDTEFFVGLTNKTYSLTAYERNNTTAWSSDNSNDDFKTPGREDYAPVPTGVEINTNGLELDVYRDRVEHFSSLAAFGYARIKLTNDQGFVRYNGLHMQSNVSRLTTDEGNNV